MKLRQLIAGGAVFLSVLATSITANADDVYKVAYVFPEVLIVRAAPSTDAREIDRVYHGQEIEVVEECGDWAKVCITLDSYGYINAYHFEYRTYYGNSASSEETVDYYDEQEEYYDYNYNYDYDYDYTYNDNYDDYDYSSDNYDYEDYSYPYEDYSSYDNYTYSNDNYDTGASEDQASYSATSYEDTTDYSQTTEDTSSGSSGSNGQYLSDYAKQYIGNPYVYGGTSLETGADCSGFTKAVLGANGISVNGRTAADQAAGGTHVSLDEAQAGDLIYYDNGNGVYHIAIYNGDGTVTHSSNSTTGVTVSDMNYSGNAAGAVRYW